MRRRALLAAAGIAVAGRPPTRTDLGGDLDHVAARLQVTRGRLDAAEPFAAASVQRWKGSSRRASAQADILLATIHVQAGEPGGLRLAHGAIAGVTQLSSVRAPPATPTAGGRAGDPAGSDYHELAQMARQVSATRA